MSKKDKKNEKQLINYNQGVVIVDRLNIRETPENNAMVIGELVKNQKVEILGIDKDFYKLQKGYAMQKYIKV